MAADLPDYSSAVTSPATHLGSIVVPANAAASGVFTLPAGTHGIAFTPHVNEGHVRVDQVFGVDSNERYWASPGSPGPLTTYGQVAIPLALDPTFESTLEILLANTAAFGPETVEIYALLSPLVVDISAVAQMAVTGPNGGSVSIQQDSAFGDFKVNIDAPKGQQLMAASLPVVVASDQPAGRAGQQLMAASLPVVVASDQSALPVAPPVPLHVRFSVQLAAAGGTSILVPGVVGQNVYGFEFMADVETTSATASEMDLENTASTNGTAFSVAFQHEVRMSFGGALFTTATGQGVRLRNQAAGAVVVRGSFTYLQH